MKQPRIAKLCLRLLFQLGIIQVGLLQGTLINTGHCQMIVGHRGASADAPENTISAFREAWNQHADGVEGDFYFTTDHQIVCIHDKDTQRTGGRELRVSQSSLAELKQLEYGSWKDEKFRGEPLPTFADVANCIPTGKLFVIELKTGPEIVPLLVEQINASKLDRANLLIIAFDSATIAKSKELLPNVRAHWLTGYKQDKATGAWTPTLETIAKTLSECKADGLGTQGQRAVVDREFISELKSRGLREFHVWTVDEPEDAKFFRELGAVGITTNRPAFIRAALAAP